MIYKQKRECSSEHSLFLLNIKLRGQVYFFSHVFPIFLPLTDTFAKQIFYLPVYRAEIVLCPGGYGGVKLWRKPKGNLFFLIVVHFISKGFLNLL